MLSASAPGKLVIVGEYAVLDGAPALVQAVDRYARVSVSAAATGGGRRAASGGGVNELIARPLLPHGLGFRFDAQGHFHWLVPDSHQRLPFVQPLMNYLGPWGDRIDDVGGGLRLTLDTSAFFDGDTGEPGGVPDSGERRKLGLGSSAALTVALAAAWYASRHGVTVLDRERWLPTLVDLHRKLQNGRGSGVDVAASLYGGLVLYTSAGNYNTGQLEPARALPLTTPADVEWMWIWLGESASTRDFLSGIDVFRRHRNSEYQAHIGAMSELASAAVAAVHNGDADTLLACIADYGSAMQRLGEAAQVPIYTDGHRRLAQLAKRFNVAFKPSGAGGGDIAMAASRDTKALSDLARQVRAAGYRVVALGPANHGLSIGSGSG